MGYLFIFGALLAGSAKGFFGKRVSFKVETQKQSTFVNAVRMSICVLISLIAIISEFISGNFIIDGKAWLFGTLAGVFVSLFMVTWLLAVRNGAFTLISVAQTFGVVVTLICSFIFLRTPIIPKQIFAILVLIVSVLIMGSYSAAIKGRLTANTILLLVICGLSSGLYDFAIKLFTYYSKSSISTLNLISYAIATIVLLGLFFMPVKNKKQVNATSLLRSTWAPLVIMSICLFANSYFKAMANNYLSPTQVYPIYQAGGLIFSAIMSAVFFKEKITLKCVLGMALAIIAILLLK